MARLPFCWIARRASNELMSPITFSSGFSISTSDGHALYIHNFRRCEKILSTPAGVHICRKRRVGSRTPAGAIFVEANYRHGRTSRLNHAHFCSHRYCIPLGCRAAELHFYKYDTPPAWRG